MTSSQPACVHRNRNMLGFPIREAKVCELKYRTRDTNLNGLNSSLIEVRVDFYFSYY